MATRPSECAAYPYDTDLIGLKAEDGFPLDGLLYTPKGGASAVVLLVHGKTCNFLGGPSRFAPQPLARQGIASFAFNMRVHSLGYSRGDVKFENFDEFQFNMAGGAWENFEDGHKDLKAAVTFLRGLGYEKITLAGHSSGAFYGGDYAGRYQDFDGLVLLSPLMTNRFALTAWFKDEAEAEAAKKQAEEMVASGEGHLIMPIRTWYYAISAATFLQRLAERPGRWDDAMRANQIPTLVLYGAREDRAKVWQDAFKNIIAAPKKEIVSVEGSEHMYLGYEDEVVDAMLAFMRRHVL